MRKYIACAIIASLSFQSFAQTKKNITGYRGLHNGAETCVIGGVLMIGFGLYYPTIKGGYTIQSQHNAKTVSNICYLGGGALTVAGVVMEIVAKNKLKRTGVAFLGNSIVIDLP